MQYKLGLSGFFYAPVYVGCGREGDPAEEERVEMRKGNIRAGFSYVNQGGGFERPSSEENQSRWEDWGKMGNEEEVDSKGAVSS